MQRLQQKDEGEYLQQRFNRIRSEEDERKNTIEDHFDLNSDNCHGLDDEFECVS
jgi:hypothetical protein